MGWGIVSILVAIVVVVVLGVAWGVVALMAETARQQDDGSDWDDYDEEPSRLAVVSL